MIQDFLFDTDQIFIIEKPPIIGGEIESFSYDGFNFDYILQGVLGGEFYF